MLGPFHGAPAVVRIEFGKGVCGTAAVEGRTQLVPDVHAIENHIACDPASNSELVVPIISGGRLVGVLDMDSPVLSGFAPEDARAMETLCADLATSCDWQNLELFVPQPDGSDGVCFSKKH